MLNAAENHWWVNGAKIQRAVINMSEKVHSAAVSEHVTYSVVTAREVVFLVHSFMTRMT